MRLPHSIYKCTYLISANIKFLGHLAVDWMNNKIYFTHYSSHVRNNILSVLDPVNFYYKALVNTTEYPISVVLDPISR